MRLAVFGDSHAEALFAAFPSIDIYWVGPVTMHRIGRYGIDSMLLPRWGFSRFRKNVLHDYDHVFLSFGEIDCRSHIGQIARSGGVDAVVVAEDLAERYVAAIADYFGSSSLPVVLCVPPVTPYSNTDEQKEIRERLNAILVMKCRERGIDFLNYLDAAPLDRGCIADGAHDDNVHFKPSATGFLAPYLEAIALQVVAHDPSYQRQPDRLQRYRTMRAKLKSRIWRLVGRSGSN
ncbi:MAG: hypothetical protein ACSHXI_20525 [Hoeflea sp.]|uniref:hypothetical protein n=1 Tax=Hoeflea sp. TaxID=1940281 RepID=UPI003EF0E776